ncbi:MAG: dihydrofolate reductase [Pseudomonadota bacterium]|nr:dihydrofolate reductase [Pseudomonadota bacterium]
MPRPRVSLIAAVARSGGIGKGNALLVRLPEDLAHFKRTTLGSPVVMGRKTWDSIGRALPGRRNVVITRNPQWLAEGAETAISLEDALARLAHAPKVYVIGGTQVFAAALPLADELVLTEIDADLDADVFFPLWNQRNFTEVSRDTHKSAQGFDFSFVTYIKNQGD